MQDILKNKKHLVQYDKHHFSFFIFVIILFSGLYPQWSTSIETPLEVSPVGTVIRGCSDGIGGAYVSWSHCCDHPHRYLQRVDRFGNIVWENPIFVGGEGDLQEVHAYMIEDGSSNTIIGLLDLFEITFWWPFWEYDSKTIIQKITPEGTKLWGENGTRVLNTTMDYSIEGMVKDGQGGAIVLLELSEIPEGYFAADSSTVAIQRISSDGGRLWGSLGVQLAYLDRYIGVMIIHDSNGGAFVRYGLDYDNFVYVRLNGNGELLWEIHYQGSWWVEKMDPTLSGGLYLSGIDDSLRLNYISPEGELSWGNDELVLAEVVSPISQDPMTIVDPDDNFIIGWSTLINEFDHCIIQNYGSNGSPIWEFPTIISDFPSNSRIRNIDLAVDDTYTAMFTDDRIDPGGWHSSQIYTQKLNMNGQKLWGEDGLQVYTSYSGESSYSTDLNGGGIYFFPDGNWGVNTHLINRNGEFGGVIDVPGDLNADTNLDILDIVRMVTIIMETG
ncbi:MAG: hypothetical protein H8E14_00215 [Candidatus Marinimicrobia bacterium]|nr:hypothetical protein [Candidatus Neomarinimicrobiota bacterium]